MTTKHKIDAVSCMKMVSGVCARCGGTLGPIETVDNSGAPTYWPGCNTCQVFCYGVDRRHYEIAKVMVESGYRPYSEDARQLEQMEKDESYREYRKREQISGTVNIVSQVLKIDRTISSRTANAT